MVYFVGGFLESETIHRLFRKAEQYVIRIPVVKSIYTAIRDLISIFSSEPGKELRQVVLVDVSASGGKQIGGFTVIMPCTSVIPLAMSVEDALRFVTTAGVVGHTK